MPTLTYTINDYNRVEIQAGTEYRDYREETPNTYHHLLSGLFYHDFVITEAKRRVTVRGGIRYEHDNQLGREEDTNDYWVYEVQAGITFPEIFRVTADIGTSYAILRYETDTALYPLNDREDRKWDATVRLIGNIVPGLQVMLIYTHTESRSNEAVTIGDGVDPYDYRRNTYSLVLSGYF